jgi:phosphoglycerate kinase
MRDSPNLPRKRNIFDVKNVLQKRVNQDRAPNVLVRVDFNVPMQNGVITDDSRIRGALPTIQALLDDESRKCNIILISHMGRPALVQKGPADCPKVIRERHELSLEPVARHLGELLGSAATVSFVEDCLRADDAVTSLPRTGGAILILENLRFYKDEEKNNHTFATKLASYADAFINDAFGTCHRAHASTAALPQIIAETKSPQLVGIGCLVASELKYLDFSASHGVENIAAIIGGSKVSTKLPVIQGLLKVVDVLILGGGLAFTFLKAMNIPVGDSLVEESMVEIAAKLIEDAKTSGTKLILPVDAVCAQAFPKSNQSNIETLCFDLTSSSGGIPNGYMGLDIGSKSVARFQAALRDTSKIVFNGPMGVFEIPPFDEGTRGLVNVLEELTFQRGVLTVVGGGDSVAALEQFDKLNAVSYVSTGGGATLELLAGDELPGVTAIPDFE